MCASPVETRREITPVTRVQKEVPGVAGILGSLLSSLGDYVRVSSPRRVGEGVVCPVFGETRPSPSGSELGRTRARRLTL